MSRQQAILQILRKYLPNYEPIQFMHLICEFLPPAFNNDTIRKAVKLWIKDRSRCISQYDDIKYWDVSQVTNMDDLFTCRRNIEELDLNEWDVSNVTSMKKMFSRCEVKQLFISNWNVSKVTDTSYMFYFCGQIQMDLS